MSRALAFVAALSACATMPTTPTPAPRTIYDATMAAVVISAVCEVAPRTFVMAPIGSGVIVSASQILTAYHVVDDARCTYFADDIAGDRHPLVLEQRSEPLDVARLASPRPFKATPVVLGDVPEPGQRVCCVTLFPNPVRRCGDVQIMRGDLAGDVKWDSIVEPGNSGSGFYDEAGRLVGVVTHRTSCVTGEANCGGRGTSIKRLSWILGGAL